MKKKNSNIIGMQEEEEEDTIEGDITTFKEDVNHYTHADDRIKDLTSQIKPLQLEIKELKKIKTVIKNEICVFMEKNNFDKCSLNDGNRSLIYRKRKTAIPITESVIKDELVRFFMETKNNEFNKLRAEEKASKIHKFIYGDREYRYTNILQNKITK
jgi:hypothetical protein